MQEGRAVLATRVRIRKKNPKIELSSLFDARAVFFLEETDRNETLIKMVGGMKQMGKVVDEEALFQALLKREALVSTGIGCGIAIPHAKLEGLDRFFFGVGIIRGEGITWESRDNLPVKLIMLLGGPKGAENQYLGLLSQITSMLRDHRLDLLEAKSPEEVAQIIAMQGVYGS